MKTELNLLVAGMFLAATSSALATVRYVDVNGANPTPPYTNWAAAALTIQQAVDAAVAGDEIVVTNGVYPGRVGVNKPLALQSANGPQFTVIDGGRTNRCASLTDGASLAGFTLTHGAALTGGGVWCASTNAFLTNCVIQGNSAGPSADGSGGGAYGGTLYNCTLSGNSAAGYGGGAFSNTLYNCTLTGNWTSPYAVGSGGGAYASTLYNCTLSGNSALSYGGGASLSTLYNCTLTGNSAPGNNNTGGCGGGAYEGTLSNCTLMANSGWWGGGAYGATLYNYTLTGNSGGLGGGANGGTLTNCVLNGNSSAAYGGGAYYGTLYNCGLAGNSAVSYGGGADGATLYNCTLSGNWAVNGGGGACAGATLYNCTLTGNSAVYSNGGGAAGSKLYNCIAYFNNAVQGANYDSSSALYYCCSTPLPVGTGNIALDPQLASASHLSIGSPCRGAASPAYASGVDIDGEAWANPPSIGCDEYHAGTVTGPLSVGIVAPYTNLTVGYTLGLTAVIEGRTVASVWDFGDGLVVSNWPCATHAWTTAGYYTVTLRAYNESYPQGVTGSLTVHVAPVVYYVSAGNPNPVAPYTNWATAAQTIQDAVDAAVVAGGVVLVSNGVYSSGGWAVGNSSLVNRVAVTKPVAVCSVNGPQFTTIRGYQVRGATNGDTAIRCVYLTNGASLSGFTLTRGATLTNGSLYLDVSGGGVCCDSTNALITNCVFTSDSAYNNGGGAFNGTLNNCSLTCNWTWMFGGGAYGSTLNNCALTCNAADSGGGARSGILNNCTLEGNAAILGMDGFGGGAEYCILNNCVLAYNTAWMGGGTSGVEGSCTANYCIFYNNTASYDADYAGTVLDHSGTGDPLFADSAGRLQSGSPCINTGNNAYVTTSTDLDGNPRIVRGTVDIGAYEFQGPGSVIPFAWLRQYGLPTDGSADYTDPDGDGMNNWQEWICGTCPTNPLSALRLLSASPTGANVTVRWQSVAGVSYFLERATNLSPSPLFTPLATGIIGQPGTTSYTDTNVPGASPFFYRVGVGN